LIRRALIVAGCFIPVVFLAFLTAIMGDCRSDISIVDCQTGKDEALRFHMGVVFLAYLATLVLRTLYRRRHGAK